MACSGTGELLGVVYESGQDASTGGQGGSSGSDGSVGPGGSSGSGGSILIDGDSNGLVSIVSGGEYIPGGAYRVRSERPVTVYQFNALEYENTNCPATDGGVGYSRTNDASLVLPTWVQIHHEHVAW